MKNAVVIGGLSGVGKGIAKALVDREFNVIVGDVNIDRSSRPDGLYFLDASNAESVKEYKPYIKPITILYNQTGWITMGFMDV